MGYGTVTVPHVEGHTTTNHVLFPAQRLEPRRVTLHQLLLACRVLVGKGDTEGVVNYGLSIRGVKFAAIFIEHKQEGIVKISLRSKDQFNVNEFAREHFEGGGHINAAGGKSSLSLSETIAKFVSLLPLYSKALKE